MRTKSRSQTTVFQKFQVKTSNTSKIEKHLIPYNFNSKGDNLRQVAFLIELEAVCWKFLIKQRCGFTHIHQR